MKGSFREDRQQNISMLTDFYEMTMGNGYLKYFGDKVAYFDAFFRRIPDGGGYAVMAGLESVVDYVSNLRFTGEDIDYLRRQKMFSEEFLEFLRDFKFTCDVWAIPEGTPVFPGEPLVTVRGPIAQAQLLETALLLLVNHQSLIATKASRIVRAADGRAISEFGARRAHGVSSALFAARSAYIAGCANTSNVMAAQEFDIPCSGTMAHSWVQMFDDEYSAFAAYAETYPDACVLLIDTYSVLKSGLPNAIKVFDEVLKPMGKRPLGVRIDSGDIAYLTKKIRARLDAAGYPDCKIVVSNSLDERIIRDTLMQGAQIDFFGVGERLVTSETEPVFGGVYKLCAVENGGEIIPKIKISENTQKITTPYFKKVYRLYERDTGKAIADVVTAYDETIDDTKPYEIFDPDYTWKRKIVTNFKAKLLTERIFDGGKLVYDLPDINGIRNYCAEQINTLWSEVTRFENPHNYYVDLSQRIWDIKNDILKKEQYNI